MQATELKIFLQNVYLIKGLYPEYIKNSYKLSDKKTMKKWMKDLNRHFTKEDKWMAGKHMEKMLNTTSY